MQITKVRVPKHLTAHCTAMRAPINAIGGFIAHAAINAQINTAAFFTAYARKPAEFLVF